jgi:hypothetical protein
VLRVYGCILTIIGSSVSNIDAGYNQNKAAIESKNVSTESKHVSK